jgi:ATP-dependent Clp protease protease subunit
MSEEERELGAQISAEDAEQLMAQANEHELLFKEVELFVNFKDRIIYVESDIDIYTPAYIRRRIDLIASTSNDWSTPITLQLCSYGGDVYAGLAVCDLINTAPMPINTVGNGPVMSAAGFILVSGTGRRAITANSYIMVHDIFGMIHGQSKDVVVETDHWKQLQEICYSLVASKTHKNKAYWKGKSRHSFYVGANQAIKLGLIDEVLTTWQISPNNID